MSNEVQFAAKGIVLPERVDPADGYLVWKMKDRPGPSVPVRPDPDLLLAFIALGTPSTSDEDIAAFARRHGILEVCREHGRPGGHLRWHSEGEGAVFARCEPISLEGREATVHWRIVALELESALRIAANLHVGSPGDPADWDRILLEPTVSRMRLLPNLESSQLELASYINRLHIQGNVRLSLSWRTREPEIEYGSDGLFGTLVAQLTLMVARADGLFVCLACGQPSWRTGRTRAKPFKYCRKCRLKGAWRLNKAAERKRMQLARQLRAEGRSIQEIAWRIYVTEDRSREQILQRHDVYISRALRLLGEPDSGVR